ncbi:hypothetical protein F3Y22_tig00111213pilonHSYRG00021 [Hibiscus syriacus]|uniref:Uncharacterized protein n=1 Tax=Hibiscus syriacus TaxID=106335 RepID=A0A6A2YVS3_HIBSY|nr:hypothetical protein F3Y22_tig00111213pilonHSYRG00021 [Hibiscus syriacus]
MVKKLGLKISKHPHPYKLQWLNDVGEAKKATHDGFSNKYTFQHQGKKIILAPMLPNQVHECQVTLKSRIEEWEKVKAMKKVEREFLHEKRVEIVENEQNERIEYGSKEEKENEGEEHILSNPTPILSFVVQDNPIDMSLQVEDSRNMSFEESINVTFGDPQDMSFDISNDVPLEIRKNMPIEVPRVDIIHAPSTLHILKRFYQQMEFFIIKQPTPIKHPPWFAISIHIVNSFSFTNFDLFCNNLNLFHPYGEILPTLKVIIRRGKKVKGHDLLNQHQGVTIFTKRYVSPVQRTYDGSQTLCPPIKGREVTRIEDKSFNISCEAFIRGKHKDSI